MTEFKAHHSGSQVAVCRKQGFVIVVEDVPESVDVGDMVRAEVTSFSRERNSAAATRGATTESERAAQIGSPSAS